MFTELKLITKRNNNAEELNADLDPNAKIYCCASLEIGFGEKITWTEGNAIRLSSLIDFYKKLASSVLNSESKSYEYEFPSNNNRLIFEWSRIRATTTFKVTLKKVYHNSTMTLVDKYYRAGSLYDYNDTFFLYVMSILIQKTNEHACIAFGELFFGNQEQNTSDLKIGQKVKTKIGDNVKTIREGYIINRFYHHKEKIIQYQILENGKRLEKRYYASDFEQKIDLG